MGITNSEADDGRPAAAEAAGARPVLRQDPGDAVSGRSLALLPIGDVLACRDAGTMLLDVRDPAEFTAGHVRGSVSIGLRGRFEECAGAVLAPDRDVVLIGDQQIAAEAAARLGDAGYDTVTGQLGDLASVLTGGPGLGEASSRLSIEQLAELQRLLTRIDSPGETTLRARATDLAGRAQPDRPHWNRLGYGGNAVQNIPLLIR